MSHIINKHSDLDDPVFNKCSHGEIGPKKCLTPGAYVQILSLALKSSIKPMFGLCSAIHVA